MSFGQCVVIFANRRDSRRQVVSQEAHMKIENAAVLLTGASRGLGAALAKELAARGARVALVARDAAALDRVVSEIRATGGTAFALPADVGDKNAVYPLAASAAELVGPLDLLIHNASSLGPTPLRLLLDTECEDLERVLAVNLIGPFRLSRAVAGSMAVRRTGTIVHLSSDAAVNAYSHWGAYSVSKAALDHLSRVWAEELSPFGVRVLAFDPGEMNTVMHREALPDADPTTLSEPAHVARRLISVLTDPSVPTGARLTADAFREAS
jgi:NAD(P)-dependent dehydrogenase (short-subunit alcohol dehydrogenase family)